MIAGYKIVYNHQQVAVVHFTTQVECFRRGVSQVYVAYE